MAKRKTGEHAVCVNRKARHDYTIGETFEAGLVLRGGEVKSLRAGRANLKDSYARINNGEAFLLNAHISDRPPQYLIITKSSIAHQTQCTHRRSLGGWGSVRAGLTYRLGTAGTVPVSV